jgi:hypothetical protein
VRDQREMAGLHLDGLGAHPLGHEALEVRIDGAVFRGNGVRLRPLARLGRMGQGRGGGGECAAPTAAEPPRRSIRRSSMSMSVLQCLTRLCRASGSAEAWLRPMMRLEAEFDKSV